MLRSTLLRVLAAAGTLILSAPLYLSHAGEIPVPAIEPASAPTAEMTPMSQFVMSPCEKKCDAEYEADAIVCGRMENQAQRKTCQDSARARYKSCREKCAPKDDCLERCRELCEKAWERCREHCPRGDKNCLSECTEELSRCLKECSKRCK